ncbi:hypothetical protein OG819_54540 [Streptomyces sp. NBC_01549]|uniref:hypothetical protein n=1 Tax=Streptomyces sp. NBC_01549 TaxID=2975874 RepID=UPI002253FACF|nr:hypothetical protein [Streptomyces sp. NBC_01549]MCX4598186.1 hypothetical protein [Streptomyces sp. NBC_01549]
MDPQIGGVAREEGAGGVVGGGQTLQGALHGLHVVEGAGRLGDQVVVERAQARGEGVGEFGRVEVFGELRTAQREDQGEQLLVPLPAEAEQALVDGGAVVGRGGDQFASELGGQLLPRHRPVVVGQQREVLSDAAFGDEVPTRGCVAVPLGVQPDTAGDSLAGLPVGELHPDVAKRTVLPAEEQVGLHRAVLGGERVEPLGVDAAVEDEREEDFQGLGLAGSVGAAQHQPAAGEGELLVPVVPQVDDPGTGGDISGGRGGSGGAHGVGSLAVSSANRAVWAGAVWAGG